MQMTENALKLSGYVAEFPLAEVIQFLGMTEKSGALRIYLEKNEETVSLFLKRGSCCMRFPTSRLKNEL